MMTEKPVVVGLRWNNVPDVATALKTVKAANFDYLVTDTIFSDAYALCKLKGMEYSKTEPFSWNDLSLRASEWQMNVVGVLRSLETYLDGADGAVRKRAQELLQKEIEFTQHIGLPALVIELRTLSPNLTRIIHYYLSISGHNSFWCKLPLVLESVEENWDCDQPKNSWDLWNQFRTLLNSEPRLVPVLDIPADLPEQNEIERWLGEPVRCIFLSTNCFTTNNSGYPVLPKRHQEVIKQFVFMGSQVVINCESTSESNLHNYTLYRQYIDYITRPSDSLDDADLRMRQFTAGYEDYLQSPLQPLQDNLESNTYEVFEKDPVKYELYRTAVYNALLDMVPEREKDTRTVVLMVVGAGRGPLVRSSLLAASKAERNIRVYAVEKNENAVNTLLHRRKTEWENDDVSIIGSDMREWDAPELADILVSELLGSFGDNELSPECLDGAQKFLKSDGIMIPQSYTSYLAPVMSSKLYNEARKLRDTYKNLYAHFETPYVVNMKNRYELAIPQKVFTFFHPQRDPSATNDRYKQLTFKISQDAVLHGFSGYFECTLYGSVLMSILPETFSEGMFSWFPIYFPIRNPIPLREGDTVKANFWRCSSRTSIWYEWNVTSPAQLPIHNSGGRSYTIGLV